MANLDDDINGMDDEAEAPAKISKKKILLFLIPALAVIAVVVGFYYTLKQRRQNPENLNYSIVQHTDDEGKATESITVFYDLPEVDVLIGSAAGKQTETLKVKISLELSKIEDIKTIEAMSSRLTDAVIAHVVELTPEEIAGSEGLYWLREELLYRMNLISTPTKISNLNFKTFELQKRQ